MIRYRNNIIQFHSGHYIFMRIADSILLRDKLARPKAVAKSKKPQPGNDNRPQTGLFDAPSDDGEIWVIEQCPAPPVLRHHSGYVTQFIHQELMPSGVHIAHSADASKKYQQANQNLQSPRGFAKISV